MLVEFVRQVQNIQGAGGDAIGRLNAWRDWSVRALATARSHLPERVVRERILGLRFDVLQTLDPTAYGTGLATFIDTELAIRVADLTEALAELDEAYTAWGSRQNVAAILDTNILWEFGRRLVAVDWLNVLNERSTRSVVLVVPIQVVEELDGLKDRSSQVKQRSQARDALRWLDELFPHGRLEAPLDPSGPSGFRLRVWVDDNDRVPLPRVDADIIDRALSLQPFVRRVVIVSRDRSMQLRARSLGLDAVPVQNKDVPAAATDSVATEANA